MHHPSNSGLHFDSDLRKVEQLSLCFISEDLSHATSFLYTMQKVLTAYLISHYPQLTLVEYFSNRCGAQCKSFKNFLNLTFHQSDFGIKASWSFFTTSHGKSPCDGIGGSVNQKPNSASLAASASQKILSTKAVFNYCSQNMPKITFFNLSKPEFFNLSKLMKYLADFRIVLAKDILLLK